MKMMIMILRIAVIMKKEIEQIMKIIVVMACSWKYNFMLRKCSSTFRDISIHFREKSIHVEEIFRIFFRKIGCVRVQLLSEQFLLGSWKYPSITSRSMFDDIYVQPHHLNIVYVYV